MIDNIIIITTIQKAFENLAIVYIARYKMTYDEKKRKKLRKQYKELFDTYTFLKQVLDIDNDYSFYEWLQEFINE